MVGTLSRSHRGKAESHYDPLSVPDASSTPTDAVVSALGPSLIACWMGLYLCSVFVTATSFYDFSLAFACAFSIAVAILLAIGALVGKASPTRNGALGRISQMGKPLCIVVAAAGCVSQLMLALHVGPAPSPVLIAFAIVCSGVVMMRWASAQSCLPSVNSGVGLAVCLALAAILLVASLGLAHVAGTVGNYAVRSSALLTILAFVPLASAALLPSATTQAALANASPSPELELSRETAAFAGGAMLTLSWAGIALVAFFATGFLCSPFWTDFSRMLDLLIAVLLAATVATVVFLCANSWHAKTRAKVPSTRIFVQTIAVVLVICGLIAYFMVDGAGTALGLALIAAADVVCAHMILAIGTGKLRRCRINARPEAARICRDAKRESDGNPGTSSLARPAMGEQGALSDSLCANSRFAQLCFLFAAMLALAVAVIFFGAVFRQALGLDAATVKNLVLCLVVVLLGSTALTAFYSLRLLETPPAAASFDAAAQSRGFSSPMESSANAQGEALQEAPYDHPIADASSEVARHQANSSHAGESGVGTQPVVIDVDAMRLERKRAFLADCGLTDRQADIALCFGDGLTMADTAEALDISINTVRYHMKTLYEKTGTEGKSDLRKKLDEVSSSPLSVLKEK